MFVPLVPLVPRDSGHVVCGELLLKEIPVETAIGVFATRELGQDAMRQLIEQKVPHELIVFLSRPELETQTFCKHFGRPDWRVHRRGGGNVCGCFGSSVAGSSRYVAYICAGLWFSGSGGFGWSCGWGTIGSAVGGDDRSEKSAADEARTEDGAFRGEVLSDWRSLIVVRTQAQETAQVAGRILGLSL